MNPDPVTVIRGGEVFDGTGRASRRADVLIEDGRIARIAPDLSVQGSPEIVEASGCWVTPGFIDNHTHYDAEIEVSPALSESVRHGVTTVTIGSCGLSMAVGDPEALADMFCRVEGVPRKHVKPLLDRVKDWHTPKDYIDHLDQLPLGPNVAALLGHSTIRAHAMGLGRSLDLRTRASRTELDTMANLLEEALDAGFLGLSVNTLRWDKMDGTSHRSRPTPSTFAPFSEYRFLNRILRRRGGIWQGVPNISTKVNLLFFLFESAGLFRPSLKTAVISLIDARANRWSMFLAGFIATVFNRFLGANFRFQSLPNIFDFWVDGMNVPVFEEIGAGTDALHLDNEIDRSALLREPVFRRRFKRDWNNPFAGRAYHRDLSETRIIACPDESVVGQSFAEVALARGVHPVEGMLDLFAEHGSQLRWYTVLGNDRPRWVEWIVRHPAVLIGFSDAGAHLRNMAHYNFPLRLLALAQRRGQPTVSEAVHRVTGELADWMGLDAGYLQEGRRADVVVVDPQGLNDELEAIHEAPMEGFDGLRRLVRRNDAAVRAVWVNGRLAARQGKLEAALGRDPGFGRVARSTVSARGSSRRAS